MKAEVLEALLAARAAKRPVVLRTDLSSGEGKLLFPDDAASVDAATAEAVRRALAEDKPQRVDQAGARYLYNPFSPPLRLVIVGAVHIAQALSRMAETAGYQVIIIDPRAAFASADRFPGLTVDGRWPDEAFADLVLDARTAVVTLTHDPKLDDPALKAALSGPCFYVGALGSRKTQAARLEHLRRLGFGETALSRVRGPVGLAIGAATPEEIAVSILAEMTLFLRKGPPS